MLRGMFLAMLMAAGLPALAGGDELKSVPADVLIGHRYVGETAPSAIHFINVRRRPVWIVWIAFDGSQRLYAKLAPGDEVVQPTFVAHRWLVRDAKSGSPIAAFISTRSSAPDGPTPQIVIIR